MFKVTIKQYVIPLYALILIAAVLTSGCFESSTGSTATANGVPDFPIQPPVDDEPKVLGTTVDGIPHYAFSGNGAFDLDGDGKYDFIDGTVDQNDASRHNNNIAIAIRAVYGIPIDSKMYDQFPEGIQELRERKHDLNGDGKFKEQIDILINGKIVYTTTTDTDQDGGVSFADALTELDWW